MSGKYTLPFSVQTYSFFGFLIPPAVMIMLVHWFAGVESFVPVYYFFNAGEADYYGVASGLALLVSCWLFLRKKLEWTGRVFLPALLFYPLCALPYDFYALAGTFIVSGWCVYRIPFREMKANLSGRTGWIAVCLCSAAAGIWSFLLQRNAYLAQWLTADWWVYMKSYYHLAFELHCAAEFLIQGLHANLLPNAVMTSLVQIFPDVRIVFAASAVLIGILPLCVYAFGGVCGLPAKVSLLLSVLAMLNPILINQSLSLFYGFHPILFFGPLLFLFFIFREKKNTAGMIAVAVLSLLIQETVIVFWAGYAVYLCVKRRYRRGVALFVFCAALFLLISNWLMPMLCGSENNTQIGHYAKLGSSLTGVVLSPVLRPAAFWEVISANANFYFLLAVLMPCGVLALRFPLLIVVILPLLAGVLLQESPDLKNPAMQYGYEFTLLLLAMSVMNAGRLYCQKRYAVLWRSIFTALVMTVLCVFYYGQIPFSRYPVSRFFRNINYQSLHSTIMEKLVPADSRVLTSELMQPFYLFNRKTASYHGEFMPGDTVVIDMNAPPAEVEPVRRRLLADRRAVPVFATEFAYSRIVVWQIGSAEQVRPVFMHRMTDDEFAGLGGEADTGNRDFSLTVARGENGGTVLFCRVKCQVNYDVEIILQMQYPDGVSEKRVLFGNGIFPAWHVAPGTVFTCSFAEPFSGRYSVYLLPRRIENTGK